MVSITIITILIALAVVGLRGARQAATRTQCLAQIRQCAAAFASYVADERDTFPLFASLTDEPAFENAGYDLGYAAQAFHWPVALRSYFGEARYVSAATCPTSAVGISIKSRGVTAYMTQYPDTYVFTSTYEYSMNFTTQSSAWTPGGDPDAVAARSAVRSAWVQHPSRKGLLVETTANHRSTAAPMNTVPNESDTIAAAYVDGSAEFRTRSRFLPGFRDGSFPVKTTLDGYRGVDR